MHRLQEHADLLADFHSAPLLDALEQVLATQTPFQLDEQGSLRIDAYSLSRAAHPKIKYDQVEIIKRPAGRGTVTVCSTNMSPLERNAQGDQLRRIDAVIEQHLQNLAQQQGRTVSQFARQLLKSPDACFPEPSLAHSVREELAMTATIDRQRFTYQNPGTNQETARLRAHLATIEILLTQDIMPQVVEAIIQSFQQAWPDLSPAQHQAIATMIQDQATKARSEMQRLVGIIEQELLGRLKQEAALQFFAFLAQQMTATDPTEETLLQQGRKMLVTIEARLRALQEYLALDVPDSDFDVMFRGDVYNLRLLFADASSFADLPIYPIIDGTLQESTDREHQQGARINRFGAKMKLNGRVSRYGAPSSYAYHLGLLRTHPETLDEDGALLDGPRYRKDRVLRLAVLYHVVFTRFSDPAYDCIQGLQTDFLASLATAEQQSPLASIAVLTALADRLENAVSFTVLQRSIMMTLKRLTPHTPLRTTVYLAIQPGILQDDPQVLLREKLVFRDPLAANQKNYLAYFQVTRTVPTDAIFTLPVRIGIDDLLVYQPSEPSDSCTMRYDAVPSAILPCYFEIIERDKEGNILPPPTGKGYGQGVRFPFELRKDSRLTFFRERKTQPQWFAARYLFALISYLCLRQLALALPARTFISLTHLHDRALTLSQPEDPDAFITMLAKTLAHTLSQEYVCQAQGLDRTANLKYKGRPAAASLFAPIAKRFHFADPIPTDIPRLALVIVSSRVCDGIAEDPTQRKATVFGEITTMLPDGQDVRVERRNTFSDNYFAADLYAHPDVIIDQIEHLYAEGFRHILYVAQAPHSTTIHLTRTVQEAAEDDFTREGLFFHSRQIIEQCVHNRQDLRFYPIFRDMFYAMKLRGVTLDAHSLYIPDTRQLLAPPFDHPDIPQMMAFLHLFSGLSPVSERGTQAGEKHNGVVSYATLLNIYGSTLNDQHLRTDLIYDQGGTTPMKQLLVRYLMLYHWSRYEVKVPRKLGEGVTVGMKIDPYDEIIGDESIGKLAVQRHAYVGSRFNFLSFLTDVRKAVVVRAPGKGR